MKPIKILIYTAVIGLVLITVFSLRSSQSGVESAAITENSTPVQSNLGYVQLVDSLRASKHQFMLSDEKSPFIVQEEPFDSLSYFPIDENFKVTASVAPISAGEQHDLQTSDGEMKQYIEVATLHFDLKGQHEHLVLLQSADKDHYFLPFYDATSAITTYGAGRYLELNYTGKETKVVLDFNQAYNPYCAYVDGYSCPVPPTKNQLSLAVEAGEKKYQH